MNKKNDKGGWDPHHARNGRTRSVGGGPRKQGRDLVSAFGGGRA